MIRNSKVPTLNKAGREMSNANNSFLMPLAADINLNIRNTRNILITKNKTGFTKTFSK